MQKINLNKLWKKKKINFRRLVLLWKKKNNVKIYQIILKMIKNIFCLKMMKN